MTSIRTAIRRNEITTVAVDRLAGCPHWRLDGQRLILSSEVFNGLLDSLAAEITAAVGAGPGASFEETVEALLGHAENAPDLATQHCIEQAANVFAAHIHYACASLVDDDGALIPFGTHKKRSILGGSMGSPQDWISALGLAHTWRSLANGSDDPALGAPGHRGQAWAIGRILTLALAIIEG